MHIRQIEEKVLTFIVSGKLWRNSLIMQDKETNSLWSHITGECLDGELAGKSLKQMPSVQTTWANWRAEHPQTRVLKKSEEIKSSQYQRYFDDPERTGLFRTIWLQDKMPGKAVVHGITVGPHAVAVADDVLKEGQERNYTLAGVPLVISRGTDGGLRATRSDTGEELLVRTAYWFAWSGFYPNTEVME